MACGQNSARWRCGGRIGVCVRVVPLFSSTHEGRGWPHRWVRVSTAHGTFPGSVELNLCAGCCAAYRPPRRRTDAQHGVWHGDQGHSIAPSDAIRAGKGAWNVLSEEAEAGLVGPVILRTIRDFYERPYGYSSLTILGHTAGVSASLGPPCWNTSTKPEHRMQPTSRASLPEVRLWLCRWLRPAVGRTENTQRCRDCAGKR